MTAAPRDDTFEAAEQLADAYPGYVQAVHHPRNYGYGAALRSGFRAALDTGHGLIAFCDADGQFDIESFGTLVAALQDDNADLSAGYRIARADALTRRVMGRAWHWLSRLVLGFTAARDVDCGFKVFTRAVLSDIEPQISGDYAAVSPEILARAVSADYTVTEAGITTGRAPTASRAARTPRWCSTAWPPLPAARFAQEGKERSGVCGGSVASRLSAA